MLLRKSPRLFFENLQGIKVRTKWQSSTIAGNTLGATLKGNHQGGDDWQLLGKTC